MASLDVDLIREMGGDLDEAISEGMMNNILSYANGNVYAAAERVALLMAARSANIENGKVGDVAVSGGKDRYNAFLKLATMWGNLSILNGFTGGDDSGPYAGGISVSDKDGNEGLTDRVKPFFTRENPLASSGEILSDEST
jgi:hypothetical protein